MGLSTVSELRRLTTPRSYSVYCRLTSSKSIPLREVLQYFNHHCMHHVGIFNFNSRVILQRASGDRQSKVLQCIDSIRWYMHLDLQS